MDGPYFHHRATIPIPDEAEEYAVDLVLSELASETRLRKIGRKLAGRCSVERRVKAIAGNRQNLKFIDKNNKKTDIQVSHALQMILNGYQNTVESITVTQKPSDRNFKRFFTSLFAANFAETQRLMRKFAAITGTRSHPGNYMAASPGFVPELGLGTVVRDSGREYWLCLQASCDSVRLKQAQAFIFVPLEQDDDQPEHVVPNGTGQIGATSFIGLRVPSRSYAKAASFEFDPDPETKTVLAKDEGSRFHFRSVKRRKFVWIADLKQRRALRAAVAIGQQMSRAGFDEFEPFRSS